MGCCGQPNHHPWHSGDDKYRTLLNPSDTWTYNMQAIYALQRRLDKKADSHFEMTVSLLLWPDDWFQRTA
jgi:hypothetical protein